MGIEKVRTLLATPDTRDDDLRAIAAEVFLTVETDETLWDDSYRLAMARGETAAKLRELMSIWRYIHGHHDELLEYGRSLRRLADLEYLTQSQTDTLSPRNAGTRESSR